MCTVKSDEMNVHSVIQIVVATPGRLLNHVLSTPELRGQLRDLRLFVLMEVQKLLDMGYRRTIERISVMISRSRQTLMWSSSSAKSDEVCEGKS